MMMNHLANALNSGPGARAVGRGGPMGPPIGGPMGPPMGPLDPVKPPTGPMGPVIPTGPQGGPLPLSQGPPMIDSQYDVCVLGAGASGMATAVFAKDNGRSVIVLENTDHIGGHCNTVRIKGHPNEWLDIGVELFPNTTAANEAGLGPWNISTVEIVDRFVGPDGTLPQQDRQGFTCLVDTDIESLIQPCLPTTSNASIPYQVAEAFETFYGIMARYPWIDLARFPDPIPEELLQPFSQFIIDNELEPLNLEYFIPYLTAGGLGDFQNLTTLFALLNLSPTINFIFKGPGTGFVINGGCERIYQGMTDYLGRDHVITRADVESVWRLPHPVDGGSNFIIGTKQQQQQTDQETCDARWPQECVQRLQRTPFFYQCGAVVVAYPPTLKSLKPFQLSSQEQQLFAQVSTRDYFTGTLTATGDIQQYNNVDVLNVNLETTFRTPILPSITQVTSTLPQHDPMVLKASSQTHIPLENMRGIVESQFQQFPRSFLSNSTVDIFIKHVYQPHFSVQALADDAYGRLADLQGKQNTFYITALNTYSTTYHVWNDAYLLVQKHFPVSDQNA